MFCPHCGVQLQPNTSVCPWCHRSPGTKVSQETQTQAVLSAEEQQAGPTSYAETMQETSPAQESTLVTTAPPQQASTASPRVSNTSKNSAWRDHLVRLVIATIILIAVTLVSNAFRSNTIYQNSLRSPSSFWDVGALGNGAECLFLADGYHLHGSADCGPQLPPQGDFLLSIDVQALNNGKEQTGTGSSHTFGLILRANLARSSTQVSMNGYYFVINSFQGWAFIKISGNHEWVLASGTNEALRPGLNVTNTLEVSAIGSRFDLFSNGTKIGQVEDTTFTSGLLRLVNTSTAQSEVVFTNISVTRTS